MTAHTNTLVILAEALAKNMARGLDSEAPEVEATTERSSGAESASFAIDTPFGRVRVDVTAID